MMLVDAGPLVALVDRADQHHRRCREAATSLREPQATVWPVVAEALYLLMDVPRGPQAILEMIERGTLDLLPLDVHDVPRIRALMTKYADRPMDLADAALVRAAEREGADTIFTVDRQDFSVYRINGRQRFRIIP